MSSFFLVEVDFIIFTSDIPHVWLISSANTFQILKCALVHCLRIYLNQSLFMLSLNFLCLLTDHHDLIFDIFFRFIDRIFVHSLAPPS